MSVTCNRGSLLLGTLTNDICICSSFPLKSLFFICSDFPNNEFCTSSELCFITGSPCLSEFEHSFNQCFSKYDNLQVEQVYSLISSLQGQPMPGEINQEQLTKKLCKYVLISFLSHIWQSYEQPHCEIVSLIHWPWYPHLQSKYYCKRLIIFVGGKFRENFGKTFHVVVIWGFIFARGNFREDKSAKNAKITPTHKFPRLQ